VRTDHVDVAEIMRDIRARIAQRHGINLTDQQIDELASRRLEAILDVRSAGPELMEQLRRAAGTRATSVPSGHSLEAYQFEADTLYTTPSRLLRAIRRLLHPLLKLFFNPAPLVMALNIQSRLNTKIAGLETERANRQAEWNALHYALLQRLVAEMARLSLETQHFSQQIEALSAKVDFNDRRVRGLEGSSHQAELRSEAIAQTRQETSTALAGGEQAPARKRRRRRGRRPDRPLEEGTRDQGASNPGDDGERSDESQVEDLSASDGLDLGAPVEVALLPQDVVVEAARPQTIVEPHSPQDAIGPNPAPTVAETQSVRPLPPASGVPDEA
jgi:hypothetical protein